MSLVAYGSSGEESDGDERSSASIKAHEVTLQNSQVLSGSALEKLRPMASNSSGAVQIVAPSLAEIEDSSSDEEEPKLKVRDPSAVGSSLMSILPPVKTGATILIPNSVKRSRPPPSLPPPKKTVIERLAKKVDGSDEDDSFDGHFFSIEETVRRGNERSVTLDAKVHIAPDISQVVPVVHSSMMVKDETLVSPQPMSELQYKKVIASKFGEASADDIRIMDVNVNDHLSQNREYIKTVSLETDDPDKAGETPNPTVRRKNHILSLAHQAKQRELALKNEWAQNKVNKNQTRAKYGF